MSFSPTHLMPRFPQTLPRFSAFTFCGEARSTTLRGRLAGYFAAFRPAVSLDSGHPFRSIPAAPV